ncbi:hypothetical protein AB6M97_07900 [Streptococcus hillyeri]|uniref:Phage protein n=1 Tax=Streptococcus hillyeri TaxID=2282420 RepID=A0A3L9DNL1_9STRE|nr:hypothetical protein [Streptococcus hillyeri]RLY02911.1 hypothetical protein EAF07_06355 [Streptococcus hillyeri]
MAKTPFTQEILLQVYNENGLISFDLLMEKLNGWRLSDIKERLNQWRFRNVINYTVQDGEITDFQLLKNKVESSQEVSEGRKLKLEAYFKQVLATAEIISKTTASDTNRLKAIQLQQQAINEIPDKYFKEFHELYA